MITPTEYYLQKLDNPFAQFLSELPRGKALREKLKNEPPAPNDAVRGFPIWQRLMYNTQLSEFHVPLPRDIDLAEEVIQLLTKSLYAKVPTPAAVADRKQVAAALAETYSRGSAPSIEAVGRALVGPPGSGKTWTLKNVLSKIPQVVPLDPKRNPLVLSKMVTWVRTETPSTRKISALVNGLITAILAAVGEDYKPLLRGSIGVQIQRLAMLCQEYCVGLIVVDEIQHILRKNQEPDIELVNFLVELSNAVNVPLLLVGTPKSEHVVGTALRQARRSFGPRWAPLPRTSKSWKQFAEALLIYQFTGTVATYDEIEPRLYHYSQGLPALAVTLFQYAQHAALMIEDATGKPGKITTEIINTAFNEKMKVVEPMVDALREGDEVMLGLIDDLKFDRKQFCAQLVKRSSSNGGKGALNPFELKLGKGAPPPKWRPDAN